MHVLLLVQSIAAAAAAARLTPERRGTVGIDRKNKTFHRFGVMVRGRGTGCHSYGIHVLLFLIFQRLLILGINYVVLH